MNDIHLHHVFNYTDVDRAFWAEHLEDWVPQRVLDAHIHIVDPSFRTVPLTEEMLKSYWVMELDEMMSADTAAHCFRTIFPGRDVSCVGFGYPMPGWDIEGANAYNWEELPKRGWHTLAMVRPSWSAEQVDALFTHPGVIAVKPYFALIGDDVGERDQHLECSIFDMLPHHQLEVLNTRRAWITLHVPRAGRLGHPDNLKEIRELRSRYPDARVVIAHLGRSYTLPHAREGLLPLADDPGLYYDTSAVLNPDVLTFALQHIRNDRILYGTDNPIFLMRGRRQWHGRTYVNRTSHPFHFNTERESPEIEAQYTLYTYEALRALKQACRANDIGQDGVEKLFFRNAEALIAGRLSLGTRSTCDWKASTASESMPTGWR